MSASSPHTLVVPAYLGAASNFNRMIFPMRKRDKLGRAEFFLDATLDELLRISAIGTNPERWQELYTSTKARYDQLTLQKEELQRRPKTKSMIKFVANYRAARMFLAACQSLYVTTKSRSEDTMRSIARGMLSIAGEDIQPLDADIPPDADVAGVVITLDRPLDDTTRQQVLDAANTLASVSGRLEGHEVISDVSSILSQEYFLASESLISFAGSDAEVISNDAIPPILPISPVIQNVYNFYGSVYSPHSNVHGTTVQIGGSGNRGSVTHSITPSNAD